MDADTVLKEWQDRTGEYSPEYYAYYGPNDTSELIRAVFDATLDSDAAILELGCSAGRHLAHLSEHGYRNLNGIDINAETSDVMEETYPDLAATGTFHFDAIEHVITDFDDGRFDAVFSVETLQHIHRDNEWVFGEIARVTNDLLITVEGETDAERSGDAESDVTYINGDFPLYYRDWNQVFTSYDFVEVASHATKRDRLRVFRAPGRSLEIDLWQ